MSFQYGNSLDIFDYRYILKACQSTAHFLCSIAFEKAEMRENEKCPISRWFTENSVNILIPFRHAAAEFIDRPFAVALFDIKWKIE